MKNRPLVSVIMNCYNSDTFLREAIDSVYVQTYPNWEIIFFDNNSSDRSAEIAQSYDEKLKYHKNEETVPLYAARNLAIEHAEGDFIAFLDCDDSWLPEKLETQVAVFEENPDIDFCYTNYYINEIKPEKIVFSKVQPSGDIFKSQISSYSVGILTVMLRKSEFDAMDFKFDGNLLFPGDLDFFIRFLETHKAVYLEKPLSVYRADNEQSISNTRVMENIKEEQELYKRFEERYGDLIASELSQAKAVLSLREFLYYINNGEFSKGISVLSPYKFYNIKFFIRFILAIFRIKI